MNWLHAFVALGYLFLCLDTLLAVFLTLVLVSDDWEDWKTPAVWFISLALAVFFWFGVL